MIARNPNFDQNRSRLDARASCHGWKVFPSTFKFIPAGAIFRAAMYLANAFRRSASKNNDGFTRTALVGTAETHRNWEGSYPSTPVETKPTQTPMLLDHTGCFALSRTEGAESGKETGVEIKSDETAIEEGSPQRKFPDTTSGSIPTTPGMEPGRNPFDDDDVDRVTEDIEESEIEAQRKIWDSRRAALANSGGRDRQEPEDSTDASTLGPVSARRSAGRTPAWNVTDSIQLTPQEPKSFRSEEETDDVRACMNVRPSPRFELSVSEAPGIVTNLSTTFAEAQAPEHPSTARSQSATDENHSPNVTPASLPHPLLNAEIPASLSWEHIPSRIIRDTITSLETQVLQYEKELMVAQDLIGTLKDSLSKEQGNRQRHVTKIAALEMQIQQLEEQERRQSLLIASLEKEREQQNNLIERLRDELVQAQRRNSSMHETEAYTDILAKLRETSEQLDMVRLERDLLEKRLSGHPLDSVAMSHMDSVCSTGKENESTNERTRIGSPKKSNRVLDSALRPKQVPQPFASTGQVSESDPDTAAERSTVKLHVEKFDRLNASALADGGRRSDKRIMRFTDWLGTGKLNESKSEGCS
jgi:TolA-binding protein